MPPHPRHAHVSAYLWLLAAIAVVVFLLYVLNFSLLDTTRQSEGDVVASLGLPPGAPAPTADDMVTAQQGFDHLITYTGEGFRPLSMSAKSGETIRFTNASDAEVLISQADTVSPLLKKNQYWEFIISPTDPTPLSFAANDSTFTVTVK